MTTRVSPRAWLMPVRCHFVLWPTPRIAVGQSGPRPSDYRGLGADDRDVELLNTGPYPYFAAEYGNYLVTDRPVDLSGTGDFSMEMLFKHVGDSIG